MNVAALTNDSRTVLESFGERKQIRYPLLSDPDSKVIRAFGILNTNIPSDDKVYGIPFPGTYIVDSGGIVRAKFFEQDHRERYSAGSVLFHYFSDDTGQARTTIETKHLKLTVSASDAVVHAGNRVALALDVELKPHIHVYAPEVGDGYIPVNWKMAAAKGWLALEASYPKARSINLPAIRETALVYEGRFRIVRDLIIGQNRDVQPLLDDGKLTVEGAFRYQACDEKMCYRPQTIPVKWTFRLAPQER